MRRPTPSRGAKSRGSDRHLSGSALVRSTGVIERVHARSTDDLAGLSPFDAERQVDDHTDGGVMPSALSMLIC